MINVLVICEQSGVVRDAFTAAGSFAVSNDLLPSESPGGCHIQADCRSLDYSSYDLLIAHPPCTYLSKICAYRWKDTQNEINQAVALVDWIWNLPVKHICIENPAGYLNTHWRKPDQNITPWQFGHPEKKFTCLWLKNLPPLFSSLVFPKNYRRDFVNLVPGTKNQAKIRSRFFPGVANAMATQWLAYLNYLDRSLSPGFSEILNTEV